MKKSELKRKLKKAEESWGRQADDLNRQIANLQSALDTANVVVGSPKIVIEGLEKDLVAAKQTIRHLNEKLRLSDAEKLLLKKAVSNMAGEEAQLRSVIAQLNNKIEGYAAEVQDNIRLIKKVDELEQENKRLKKARG